VNHVGILPSADDLLIVDLAREPARRRNSFQAVNTPGETGAGAALACKFADPTRIRRTA
jgi:hypothetical protein